jgi:hypothetical protein
VFGDELIIGSIRAQSSRLKQVLDQLETDERWKENSLYYSNEIQTIEKCLRKIRKTDFEPVYKCYKISLNRN